ncbi:SUKH-4 family immunity protein [Gimesia sp.]|uniref:SUKH-4 family immunity protein n=1 Tax=Gimesia sp. TaxID=2024833 RepID=UPI003A9434DF
MNTHQDEVFNYWDKNQLVRATAGDLVDLELPEATCQYLLEVGVAPFTTRLKQLLGFDFDHLRNNRLCTLPDHFPLGDKVPEEMRSWVLIGHCFEQLLCIEAGTGNIYLLDGTPASGFLKWFVNTSVSQLMFCITKSLDCFENARQSKKASNPVPQLKASLSDIDPDAFANQVHWWPTILNEIASGQM